MGASLNTYFIGACLIQYANVDRYWLRHEVCADSSLQPFELARVADSPATQARGADAATSSR